MHPLAFGFAAFYLTIWSMNAAFHETHNRAIAILSVLFLPFVAAQRKTDIDRLVIDDLSPSIVSGFLSHLEQARSCSVATRNQRLATLHAFARYTGNRSPEHAEWCAEILNVPFKRGWRTPVTYLEKEEMDALLQAPDRGSKVGQRDYVLLLFLYNSGARASEAVRVAIEDLTWDSRATAICG